MLSRFLSGARAYLRGAQFLGRRPRVWKWVTIPFLLTLGLFALIGALFVVYLDVLLAWIPRPGGTLGDVLGTLLSVLAIVALGLAAYFSFFAVAALIAAPIGELLSEAVEEYVTGHSPPPTSFARFARELVKTIAHETRKISSYLLVLAALGALALLVPGPGLMIYTVGGFLATCHFGAYDALDAILARRGWSYRQKRDYLARHRARTLGFGAAFAVATAVPIVSALAFPIGVAGATLMFLENE